jgi:lipopolysaccharide biosynthesis glycosyltransferase
VYYLHPPNFSLDCQRQIREALASEATRFSIHFVSITASDVEGLPLFRTMKQDALPPVMWYRALLPNLLPHEPQMLYLDSDLLVLDSLLPLWNTPLQGKALAAVVNPFYDNDEDRDWFRKCGLDSAAAYFNSGVMIMDLDRWRSLKVTENVLRHGVENAHWTRFGDQDSLVAVLHSNWMPLAPRWNVARAILSPPHRTNAGAVLSPEALHDAAVRPAIIHFTGDKKPWVDPRLHPYGRIYERYLRQLSWPTSHTPWAFADLDNWLWRRRWFRLRRVVHRLKAALQRLLTR